MSDLVYACKVTLYFHVQCCSVTLVSLSNYYERLSNVGLSKYCRNVVAAIISILYNVDAQALL